MMELFTKLEITIMVSIVGFLVFAILLLSLLELLSKRKEKKNLSNEIVNDTLDNQVEIQKTDDNIEDNLEQPIIETKDENIEVLQESLNIENNLNSKDFNDVKPCEDTLKIEEPEILIEDLDDPIVPNVEILETEPELQKKAQLELLKVEEELKSPMSLEDTISSLEAIEEESAIISYQELLDVTKEMQIVSEDVGDEPISITEVYERFTGESMEHPSVDDIYQASLVNSPETENLNEIQLENTANLEKLDKEIRKTNKVLNMLNELKKNLD